MGIVKNRCRNFNKFVLWAPEPRTQERGFKMTICLSVCCLYMNPPNTKGPNFFKPTQDLKYKPQSMRVKTLKVLGNHPLFWSKSLLFPSVSVFVGLSIKIVSNSKLSQKPLYKWETH